MILGNALEPLLASGYSKVDDEASSVSWWPEERLVPTLPDLESICFGPLRKRTRLNQEGARLAADLSHSQKSLYEAQSQGRRFAQQLTTLRDDSQQAEILAARLTGKEEQMLTLKEQVRTATARANGFSENVRELELALTAAKASLAAQQEVVTEVRSFFDAREQSAQKLGGEPQHPGRSKDSR